MNNFIWGQTGVLQESGAADPEFLLLQDLMALMTGSYGRKREDLKHLLIRVAIFLAALSLAFGELTLSFKNMDSKKNKEQISALFFPFFFFFLVVYGILQCLGRILLNVYLEQSLSEGYYKYL